MGIQICTCSKDAGNIPVPYSDFSLENISNFKKQQKVYNNQVKINKDSICLPNGNNINSFFDNKDIPNNQNDLDHFNISLSPITKGRKNININIININNDSSNMKNNNNSISNVSGINNIDTNKIFINKSGNDPVLEESLEKEESNYLDNQKENDNQDENDNLEGNENQEEENQEEENENQEENESNKEDSKDEENKKEMIEKFDE